jgi:Carboxypeptidase regulatory-like domain
LGAGIAFDRETKGVGELFWQPSEPLEIAMSATAGSQVDFLGRLSYRPSSNFSFATNSDQFSTTANANWRLTPNFSAISTYESLRGTTVGGEYFTSGRNSSTILRSDISDRGQIRAYASQRWENLQATLQRNESSNNAELSYRLPTEGGSSDGGHEFVLGYQNSQQTLNTRLTSALWRYRSPERVGDGRYLWQTEVGYGWSGFGAGWLAAVDVNILPGLQLRSSYRGLSDTSNQDSYAIELTTTLLTSGGVRGTFDRVENFRTVGKVVFQPFLDKNQNGRQDPGEEGYWDPLLIRMNDRPIAQYRPQLTDDRGDLNLPSGSYRLDIDPAGYPLNYRSRTDALRVEVVPSGVTTIAIPLIPAYVAIGVVKDTKGDAVPGARVEGTNLTTKTKVFSITNDAGFYTLEGLEQGEYTLKVSDLVPKTDKLNITPSSQPTQELNLTIEIPAEKTEQSPAPTPTPSTQPPNINPSVNYRF